MNYNVYVYKNGAWERASQSFVVFDSAVEWASILYRPWRIQDIDTGRMFWCPESGHKVFVHENHVDGVWVPYSLVICKSIQRLLTKEKVGQRYRRVKTADEVFELQDQCEYRAYELTNLDHFEWVA